MKPTLTSAMPTARSTAIRSMLVSQAANTRALRTAVRPTMTLRRPSVRRIALGSAVAVAATATAAGLLVSDPAAPPAYATWTAVPQTAPAARPSSNDIEEWASKCTDLGVGGIGVQGVRSRPEAAASRKVLVDRRGDFTFCVDVALGAGTAADPLIAMAGLRADGGREKGLSRMAGTVYDKPVQRPRGDDVLVLGGDLKTPPPAQDRDPDVISIDAYQLYGLAGTDVTGVDIVLTNGLRVTATVYSGTWGAWWPAGKGDPTGSRLEVRTDTGVRSVDPTRVQLEVGAP